MKAELEAAGQLLEFILAFDQACHPFGQGIPFGLQGRHSSGRCTTASRHNLMFSKASTQLMLLPDHG
jgi:hypothetical protein